MSSGFSISPLRSLDDFLLSKAKFKTPRFSQRIASNLNYYQTNYFIMTAIIFLIFGKRSLLASSLLSPTLVLLHSSMRSRNLKNKLSNTIDLVTNTQTPMGVILDVFNLRSDDFLD